MPAVLHAHRALDEEERQAIEAAIDQASRRTSADVLVVVAPRSGSYERAEAFFGLLCALTLVAVAWYSAPSFGPIWNDPPPARPGLAEILALTFVGFLVGTWLAARFPALARPFFSDAARERQLLGAARRAFLEHRAEPHGPTAMIYVSLLERWAWVVGDEDAGQRVDAAVWQRARDDVLEGFRRGTPRWAIADAVWRCGEALAEVFPTGADGESDRGTGRLRVLE